MIDLAKNYRSVQQRIAAAAAAAGKKPEHIGLVAVSKLASVQAVQALAALGQLDFGENRVQQGRQKVAALANDRLRWHLIGRIQTNKVKSISPFFLIHSLDRWNLAVKMAAVAREQGVTFNCLVQVNVAADPAKAGIGLAEVEDFLSAAAGLGGLNLRGLMTITALGAEQAETLAWFRLLADKFGALKGRTLAQAVTMDWLSMGMSADFELAIAAGANLVRVGSAIFAKEADEHAR